MFNSCYIINTILFLEGLILVNCYEVKLWDNGPIVKGATITFNAAVSNGGDIVTSGSFKYKWEDNAIPAHTKEEIVQSGFNSWSVQYNKTYPQGPYVVQVTVCKYYLVYCFEVGSNRLIFYISETLNGNITLSQNNKTREGLYVSSADPVQHDISLKLTDANFVKAASTVLTYWFVDCTYYGFTSDYQFHFNYTQPDKEHFIEALVVADFNPLPPPPTTTAPTTTSTTTTSTTTTTTPVTTTRTTTVTTSKIPTSTAVHSDVTTTSNPLTSVNYTKSMIKRDVAQGENAKHTDSQITVMVNGVLMPYNGSFPYVCNSTTVATDPNKTYGHFFRRLEAKAPVAKVNITGNNWLQHGELLTLNVKCQASKDLQYCVKYFRGVHNITGNETCDHYTQLDRCEFTLKRYFMDSMEYTIIIIIENEVSKKITPVTVTVYKVKKQAQLSVIVVPVAFSLIAVVLIVFGLAYYFQNRSRFVVEVADFNFGQNYSDMEYKTFKERLRDSIANAFFTRAPSPGSSEVPVWPPGRKYGSMTS